MEWWKRIREEECFREKTILVSNDINRFRYLCVLAFVRDALACVDAGQCRSFEPIYVVRDLIGYLKKVLDHVDRAKRGNTSACRVDNSVWSSIHCKCMFSLYEFWRSVDRPKSQMKSGGWSNLMNRCLMQWSVSSVGCHTLLQPAT